MVKCVRCGEELPEGARFCGRCGYLLSSDQEAGAATIVTSWSQLRQESGATWQAGRSMTVSDQNRGSSTPPDSGSRKTPVLLPPVRPGALRRKLLIAGILVVIVGALALGGLLLLTQPQPLIRVTSSYHVGTMPAGAAGTDFAVNGEHFAANSTIRFLLDEKPLPSATAHSDAEGKVSATLKVTDAWPPGTHTLTASDGAGHLTPQGVTVAIVQQGEAHTPGPNGAPPDDTSFKLIVALKGYDSSGQAQSGALTLVVTGHPDPAGGTVCGINGNGFPDDGRPHQVNLSQFFGLEGGQGTISSVCQGSYKGGRLNYTRIVTYERLTAYVFLTSATCTFPTPYDQLELQGTFIDAHTAAGTFTIPPVTASCSNGQPPVQQKEVKGTWTGQLQQ
jgi:hypothetical protein